MAAIAAHLRYISNSGRLEDDRGVVRAGKESLKDLADQWRHSGALIPEEGHRREAFNIMLSMPRGTDAKNVQCAAREFASAELAGHRYVMVPRPPGQSARASQRAGDWPRQLALKSPQGCSASLARDVRGETARLRHRGRGIAAGHAWRNPAV
jgi:hypothetical protein